MSGLHFGVRFWTPKRGPFCRQNFSHRAKIARVSMFLHVRDRSFPCRCFSMVLQRRRHLFSTPCEHLWPHMFLNWGGALWRPWNPPAASLVPPCQRQSCAPSGTPICATGSRPWSPPQDSPRTGPFPIETVLKVRENPAPFQKSGFDRQACATRGPSKAILCYERAFKGTRSTESSSTVARGTESSPALGQLLGLPLVGPPIGPFLPPWCLLGASQAVQ